ncbi:MAG: autotransporter domain-containing protein, partial [Desulfuromusa sp.]|nr:autotransporter domain-containing protein [Desulfuromusa sp.]
SDGDIITTGALAHGIVAQSVGGGGGSGGSAMTFEFSNADIMPEIPVLDDISGLTTIEMTLEGSGGAGGDGGNIVLNSDGNIWTSGDFAMGVVAQSIAGGGGLVGFYNPHGITNSKIVNTAFNMLIDTDAGLSFAGSVGEAGTAGDVTVNHTGNIQTLGDGAHGLFAQSAAGQGAAGNVDMTLNGNIYTFGEHAFGIYAQSGGSGGNGDISVTIHDGIVMGGSGMGSGLFIAAGSNNSVWNSGLITSESDIYGHAIRATGGNEFIENYGTVTGNVSLGTGANAFNNQQGATFNTGATVDLGTGNLLNNAGILSPGGSGNVVTTALTGNLVQIGSGDIFVNIDSSTGTADRLNVSGTADLGGTVNLNIHNPGYVLPGTHQSTIVTAGGGITDFGLSLDYLPSAVMDFNLLYPNSIDVVLSTVIDFSPQSLNPNQRAIAEAVNSIQLAGGTESFAPVAAELLYLPDVKSIGNAYDRLSPESYAASVSTTFQGTQRYTQTLVKRIHSIRSYLDTTGIGPGTRQTLPHSMWIDGFGAWGDQKADSGFTGFDYSVSGFGIGGDRLFKDGLLGGMSYGRSHADIDLDGEKGWSDITSHLFSLYGSLFSDKYYLDIALSYGKESFDNLRQIVFGELSERAVSDHQGDLFSSYTEVGYNFEMNKWIVQPFAALQYSYLDEESFRETGDGGANLSVDGRKTDALVSDLGLRFNRPFGTNGLVYIPEVSVAWRHNFNIDDRLISAAFEDSPDVSFATKSRDRDDGILIGIGVTLINSSSMSAYLRYDGEKRGDFTAQRISGGLRFEF